MGNHKATDVTAKGAGDGGADIDYELIIDTVEGTASFTCGGEVIWQSDQDQDYSEEWNGMFIDIDDEDAIDELVDWLVRKGYAPPEVEYDLIDLEDSMRSLDS